MFSKLSRSVASLVGLWVLLGTLLASPAMAKNYVVEVHGIVCQFCSFGVAKKLKKLDFIDPAQYEKGVKVDIENQSVYFGVKEGESLDEEALFKAIESGGYKPIKAWPLASDGSREAVSP